MTSAGGQGAAGLLDGAVALVVGAGSGIGRGVTQRFTAEGASVVAFDVAAAAASALAESLGDAVEPVVGDATVPGDVQRAVDVAGARFGRLDVLVCCAGRFDFRVPLSELTPVRLSEAFDEIFAVNVKSMVLAAHAAADALRQARGSVVLTLSSSAMYPEGAGVLYGASKWATRGLVAHLARELAPEVRVNGVAPGGTGHTALRGLTALDQHHGVGDVPGREERIAQGNLLGAVPTPADHAGAYVFLASARLSPMVTGAVVTSDGGRGEPLGAGPDISEQKEARCSTSARSW